MLREIHHVKQSDPGRKRRCFACRELVLTTWEESCGSLVGFRLTYQCDLSRWALIWERIDGFEHFAVDDGEASGAFHKSSPQLMHAPEPDLGSLAFALSEKLVRAPGSFPQVEATLALLESSA